MIGLEDRRTLARDIDTAHATGARLRLGCKIAAIDERTLQRWKAQQGLVQGDGRPQALRPSPAHALSADERATVLRVANEERFAAVPPARIVPMLADEGVYLASESTFSRVLRANEQSGRRGRAKPPKAGREPTTHVATATRQVWCWDMTYLPAAVIGRWFHLYLILDLFSRKIVGWEVHDSDHADHAAHVAKRTALAEGIAAMFPKPVLHGDLWLHAQGHHRAGHARMAGCQALVLAAPSEQRQRLRRVAVPYPRYRSEFSPKGFADLDAARAWAEGFVRWYNTEHRHSGIRYVTPEQRHCGQYHAILAARHTLYTEAKAANPARWSGNTRNWKPVLVVTLNPERDSIINAHLTDIDKQPLAA